MLELWGDDTWILWRIIHNRDGQERETWRLTGPTTRTAIWTDDGVIAEAQRHKDVATGGGWLNDAHYFPDGRPSVTWAEAASATTQTVDQAATDEAYAFWRFWPGARVEDIERMSSPPDQIYLGAGGVDSTYGYLGADVPGTAGPRIASATSTELYLTMAAGHCRWVTATCYGGTATWRHRHQISGAPMTADIVGEASGDRVAARLGAAGILSIENPSAALNLHITHHVNAPPGDWTVI